MAMHGPFRGRLLAVLGVIAVAASACPAAAETNALAATFPSPAHDAVARTSADDPAPGETPVRLPPGDSTGLPSSHAPAAQEELDSPHPDLEPPPRTRPEAEPPDPAPAPAARARAPYKSDLLLPIPSLF